MKSISVKLDELHVVVFSIETGLVPYIVCAQGNPATEQLCLLLYSHEAFGHSALILLIKPCNILIFQWFNPNTDYGF